MAAGAKRLQTKLNIFSKGGFTEARFDFGAPFL